MEQSRTSNTGQLIDLLRQSYAARRDPTSSPDAPSDVAAKLDREMIRMWGPPDGRGISL
jgi:hypothetical protein